MCVCEGERERNRVRKKRESIVYDIFSRNNNNTMAMSRDNQSFFYTFRLVLVSCEQGERERESKE